ncbi:MAG TPA: hypothetical protein DHW82_02900 [Spirochaetia bacterium]|nr:MAG: permease [Spirochaetes bacterium GWB1_36_13]HCL55939.1 hypothetical protein [Spirochaetia bacterium]
MSGNKKIFLVFLVFLAAYLIPFQEFFILFQGWFPDFSMTPAGQGLKESFLMLSEYAHEHVLFCLVPAFFIAGGITLFLDQQSVIAYLGPKAKKWVAYSVASVSGTILAVCSCTVLPIFKGIYRRGAGLGPAVSFLYSGPAINILAIILTARVLGFEIGAARTIFAVVFSVVIGLLMHLFFRKEDQKRLDDMGMFQKTDSEKPRKLSQNLIFMLSMIGILIFLNWAPSKGSLGFWDTIYQFKYWISGLFGIVLLYAVYRWFKKDEIKEWTAQARDFGIQIIPLLFAGVLIAGFLLGRPGQPALIPQNWITSLVGDNGLFSNFIASFSGALMYFATLTEIPIMQGLIGAGMAKGPALALLLAGPSLSLPSLLVIKSELGWKKTLVYAGIVIVLSTLVGMGYGAFFS